MKKTLEEKCLMQKHHVWFIEEKPEDYLSGGKQGGGEWELVLYDRE